MTERRFAGPCFNDMEYYARRKQREDNRSKGIVEEDPAEVVGWIIQEKDPELEGATHINEVVRRIRLQGDSNND